MKICNLPPNYNQSTRKLALGGFLIVYAAWVPPGTRRALILSTPSRGGAWGSGAPHRGVKTPLKDSPGGILNPQNPGISGGTKTLGFGSNPLLGVLPLITMGLSYRGKRGVFETPLKSSTTIIGTSSGEDVSSHLLRSRGSTNLIKLPRSS